MTKILSNQLRCGQCGDEIYSASVHDFKTCKCGAVSVDGGLAYLRRVGDFKNAEEMSISVPDKVVEDCEAAIIWSRDTGRNDIGLICAIFRALRDNGYDMNRSDT